MLGFSLLSFLLCAMRKFLSGDSAVVMVRKVGSAFTADIKKSFGSPISLSNCLESSSTAGFFMKSHDLGTIISCEKPIVRSL
jgi:hypothetical protein